MSPGRMVAAAPGSVVSLSAQLSITPTFLVPFQPMAVTQPLTLVASHVTGVLLLIVQPDLWHLLLCHGSPLLAARRSKPSTFVVTSKLSLHDPSSLCYLLPGLCSCSCHPCHVHWLMQPTQLLHSVSGQVFWSPLCLLMQTTLPPLLLLGVPLVEYAGVGICDSGVSGVSTRVLGLETCFSSCSNDFCCWVVE